MLTKRSKKPSGSLRHYRDKRHYRRDRPRRRVSGIGKKELGGTLTVVGGPHVTALPAETLEEFPAIDIGVVGEGEETLAELLSAVGQKNAGTQLIPAP